jgi:hypothetical protein
MSRKTVFNFILLTVLASACSKQDVIPSANPNVVYFLVTEIDTYHGDSFILPLVEKKNIEQARAMIANPADQKIVFAEITKDKSLNFYTNKDLLRDKRWSWHIARFLGFNDLSPEIYDGWPQYVEDNYDSWVENTKGQKENGVIGFWGYRIKREVSAQELE